MPFFNRKTPSNIFHSSTDSEIICSTINNTDRLTFIILVNKLLDRMSQQESQKRDTKISLNKIFGRHFEVFSKFAATAKDFNIYLSNCKCDFKLKVI